MAKVVEIHRNRLGPAHRREDQGEGSDRIEVSEGIEREAAGKSGGRITQLVCNPAMRILVKGQGCQDGGQPYTQVQDKTCRIKHVTSRFSCSHQRSAVSFKLRADS